jgi:hypothetical protein
MKKLTAVLRLVLFSVHYVIQKRQYFMKFYKISWATVSSALDCHTRLTLVHLRYTIPTLIKE